MGKTISESKLQEILDQPKKASKNHFIAYCPFCHDKEKKFYINKVTQLWDCKKCGEKGSIFTLLKKLGKLELIQDGSTVTLSEEEFEKIPSLLDVIEANKKVITEAEETVLPIGFKHVFYDSYLEGRGFNECDYHKYPCGVVDINKKLKNFILFLVYENNVLFGYLGRNKMPKSEIDAINKDYKEQELNKRILRWNNSDADFSKLVYGIDDVTSETLCVIIVESIFGKKRIDDYLEKHKINEIKCVSTFGSKISEMQISKISEKGVRNVILMFDPDAVNKIKNYSFDLECCFDSVEIAIINDNEDIDTFTDNDIYQSVFANVTSSFEYFSNKLQIKIK